MIWYMLWYDMIWYAMIRYDIWYDMIWCDMIYLTAIGLLPGGSSTVHIYTKQYIEQHSRHKTIHRTTQLTNWEECGPCPVFARYTLAFALQLRKKHEKTSVRVAGECQLFYILLTVHLVMMLGEWPTWRTILFFAFISILYRFRATSCSSSGESIVSIQHLVYVTLCRWPARETVTDRVTYTRCLYWHNWFSWWWARGYSKHVEKWNKYIEKNCASSRSFTKNVSCVINDVFWTAFFMQDRLQDELLRRTEKDMEVTVVVHCKQFAV